MKRWPFVSTDSRVTPAPTAQPVEIEPNYSDDDGQMCACVMPPGVTLTGRELLSGRCTDCGKRLS